MKKSKANKIITKIAVEQGISTAEVRKEIESAIEIGFANFDKINAKFWLQWGGRKPSIDEFLTATNEETQKRIAFCRAKQ